MIDPNKNARPARQITATFGLASIPETNSAQSQPSIADQAAHKSSADEQRFYEGRSQANTGISSTGRTVLNEPAKLNFDYRIPSQKDQFGSQQTSYGNLDKSGNLL